MELLRLYWRRLWCWGSLVGREGFANDIFGLVTAWRVACSIHPLEDLKKWWLGTGWMGPEAPDWYAGWPDLSMEIMFRNQIQQDKENDRGRNF